MHVGKGMVRRARRAHRAEAAEEQVGDDRRHVGMAELAARLQPGEHPVHHAEQQHRQRLVELERAQLRPRRGDRVGESGDDLALAVEDAAAVGRRQEADVLGQDAVLGLRAGVDLEEGRDQAPDPGLGLVASRRRPPRPAPRAGRRALRRSRAAGAACRESSGRAKAWKRRRPRPPRSSRWRCSRGGRTASTRGRGSARAGRRSLGRVRAAWWSAPAGPPQGR